MKDKPILCKPVPGGMTEQEKAEAGLLYNPNRTTEMADYRFKIQDAIYEYNQFRPSQVQERRDFLANIFGKIGKNCKGEEKVQRINAWLKEQGLSIDKEHSAGYGDSPSDAPMLLLTTSPTLVNPKRKLVKAIPAGRILNWR